MSVESFLQAIHDDPDDDNLRLVFADWLDDHGQSERAEFIRLQIAFPPLDYDWRWAYFGPLFGREKELLSLHRADWLGEVPPKVGAQFHRGLLQLKLPFEMLPEDLPPLLRRCLREGWVETLILHLSPERVRRLVAGTEWGQVSRLGLRGQFSLEDPTRYAGWPSLRHLHELWLFNLWDVDYQGYEAVGVGIADAWARALAESPFLGRLQALTFWSLDMSVEGVTALTGATALPRLRELNLFRDYSLRTDVTILRPLLRRHSLRCLGLGNCGLGNEQVATLAAMPELARLEELRLRVNNIGPAGVEALGASPHLTSLRTLSLRENPVDNAGAVALAGGRSLARLTHLNLMRCGIRSRGTQAVARSPNLSALTSLDLSFNRPGKTGIAALVRAVFQERLQRLWLPCCQLTSEDAQVLTAGIWPSLEYLSLNGNTFGNNGIKGMRIANTLQRLTGLSLRYCNVSWKMRQGLKKARPRLTHLDG